MPSVIILQGSVLEYKDPGDFKDYAVDWTNVLVGEGEATIASSVWSVPSPTGLVIASAAPYAPTISGKKAVIWVASGVAGTKYKITNTIVTASSTPRTHEVTITIPCANR